MVSRILISIALLYSSVAMSQDENGLTFSQVLIVDISSEVVVPEGKVWKVVSTLRLSNIYSSDVRSIKINDVNTVIGALYSEVSHSLPLWLPEATTIFTTDDILYRINVIEFNTD